MKKTIWIIILLILAIIIGFRVGVYLYNKEENKKQLDSNVQNSLYNNTVNNTSTEEIQTSVAKEKISINTEVVEEIYYVQCDHLIRNTRKDIKSLVNMTKEELAKKYPDWDIKEFSTDKVTLYKEEQGFCNEHYLVKDVDGVVTIYNMDNEDKINDLIEITEVETKYLTETDQEDLKQGIRVYTEQKLNKLLEDFE